MQNVLIDKPYKFVPRIRTAWPQSLYCKLGLYRRELRRLQGVVKYECRNLDRLRESVAAGHGIMLTPNHPRMADPMVMCHLAQQVPCNFYAMASWHLFNQGWMTKWILRLMGAFSVNREGVDREAVKAAIDILAESKRPLVIFPEGALSQANDRLNALMEGVSFIASAAARKRSKGSADGHVMTVPIAIKYVFKGDLRQAIEPMLIEMEERLSWRPQRKLSLVERIYKLGHSLLTLKEMAWRRRVVDTLGGRDRECLARRCVSG